MAKKKHHQQQQQKTNNNTKHNSNMKGPAKKPVNKERGTLLSVLYVLIGVHGILGAYVGYSTLKAEYVQTTWALPVLTLVSVAAIVAAVAMWYWNPITPTHLGRLLASPLGMMKLTDGRHVVPVINMVDDAAHEAAAREAAEVALASCSHMDRVVLTCLARSEAPIVAVVRR